MIMSKQKVLLAGATAYPGRFFLVRKSGILRDRVDVWHFTAVKTKPEGGGATWQTVYRYISTV
jgi:hypothetical protein